jgi:hypothetical protein
VVARSHDPLRALAALERRYDGAIPEMARRIALAGSENSVIARQAAGQAGLFAELARVQLRALRRRRADGSLYPGLLADLALYRRERNRWRRLQNEADNPPSTVRTWPLT